MKNIFFMTLSLAAVLILGCSNQVRVTGKVTFEDGTPLTEGKVVFDKDTSFQAVGQIQSDGSYTLGSYKVTDGVPRGTYKVYITGAVSSQTRDVGVRAQTGEQSFERGQVSIPMFTKLIHPKYEAPETSGLVCEVNQSMKYDIKVTPP